MSWDFSTEPEFEEKLAWMRTFVRDEIIPLETLDLTEEQFRAAVRPMQEEVKARGLWAAHLPPELGGGGFGQVKLGLMHEILGQCSFAPYVFGNNAPDSGNAELLAVGIESSGRDDHREKWLEPLLDGRIRSAFSMTEPGAGADPTLLKTTAVRDGDEWVINGHKWFTSNGSVADILLVMVVTNPDVHPYQGASMIVVPTTAEGFSWTPVQTMAGPTTSATYYQDVRVPMSNRVGAENEGWPLITNQLNHERVALTSAAPILTALREVGEWAQQTKLADGRRVIDQEWVQVHLARVHARAQFARLMNWRIASGAGVGPADASATKVFGTEFATEAYRLLMEVVGPTATLRRGTPGSHLAGRLERFHRSSLILTFGGGTNEVQRDIIAMMALGQPPAAR